MQMFRYLHYGLAGVLAFIGLNMIGDYFLVAKPGGHLIPTWSKLLVIAVLLAVSIVASIAVKRKESL
jgi:tellurite resistance protein TerC